MIQFSKEAVDKVHYFLENAQQADMVLRIELNEHDGEDPSYLFKLEPHEHVQPKDLTMPMHGFFVRMDSKTAIKLANNIVDWQAKDGKAGFAIQNSDNTFDPKANDGLSVEQQILGVLKTIYDPEIPVNIYDMGLIYHFEVQNGSEVSVLMTLTAPNCPAAEVLPSEVEEKIMTIPSVTKVDLQLTWEPAWTPERMTEEARLELGM